MPRKQRFKPSRKPKPMREATQEPARSPASSPASSVEDAADLEPAPRDSEPHEVHPDDVEVEPERPGT